MTPVLQVSSNRTGAARIKQMTKNLEEHTTTKTTTTTLYITQKDTSVSYLATKPDQRGVRVARSSSNNRLRNKQTKEVLLTRIYLVKSLVSSLIGPSLQAKTDQRNSLILILIHSGSLNSVSTSRYLCLSDLIIVRLYSVGGNLWVCVRPIDRFPLPESETRTPRSAFLPVSGLKAAERNGRKDSYNSHADERGHGSSANVRESCLSQRDSQFSLGTSWENVGTGDEGVTIPPFP